MNDDTILFLTYYYNQELKDHRLLKYARKYLGAYLPWDIYLYEPLCKLFPKVILYDYLERSLEIGIKAVNAEILDVVRNERPKYVLWTSWRHDILEDTFEQMRREGTTIIGWFFDDEIRFDNYSYWWVPYLDYVVTNSAEAVPKYETRGARVINIIPNTGAAFERDWEEAVPEAYDVSFVGGLEVGNRRQFIRFLGDNGVPVRTFGAGSGGYVTFEQMIETFQQSKINLNFSEDVNKTGQRQIKGRVFQVCLAGGFILTEYAPGIEDYFVPGKEIVCFETREDMLEKIKYFLVHEDERQAIARAGWQRAVSEHSSEKVTAAVFRRIDVESKREAGSPLPPPVKGKAGIVHSRYHLLRTRALLEEEYANGLWKDHLKLSIIYAPRLIDAHVIRCISVLPGIIRIPLLKLYALLDGGRSSLALAIKSWRYSMGKRAR